MYTDKNIPEAGYAYPNRTFQNPSDIITGKSVVTEHNPSEYSYSTPINPWLSLTDYLKNYTGKTIDVVCQLSGGRYYEKKGRLIITGSNFIGIQTNSEDNLLIIESGSIKSISIYHYK
jgi:hypothetical protein